MLISLHLPKTAGNSFAGSLNEHFGKSLLRDYSDLPLHHSKYARNKRALTTGIRNFIQGAFTEDQNIECIHGHFLPLKYRFNRSSDQVKYVTWMREPAERLASQYYYMKRHYTPEKAKTQSLLKRIVDEEWSLERFCLGPELRNTYSQFLWGFPLHRFNFIGILENYETELAYFSENILGQPLKEYKDNINPSATRESYFKDTALKQKVLEYHANDVKLYNRSLALQNKRLNII